MMEVSKLLTAVLLFSLVILGTSSLMGAFTSEDVDNLPGQEAGEDLSETIEGYVGDFSEVAEEPSSGSLGFLGLAGLIKTVLWDAPGYVGAVMFDSISYLKLPPQVYTYFLAALTIFIIALGILLYRGVKA